MEYRGFHYMHTAKSQDGKKQWRVIFPGGFKATWKMETEDEVKAAIDELVEKMEPKGA